MSEGNVVSVDGNAGTHPGTYLALAMLDRNIGLAQLSQALFLSDETTLNLLSGIVDMTPQVAYRLSMLFGEPYTVERWMYWQSSYEAARGAE